MHKIAAAATAALLAACNAQDGANEATSGPTDASPAATSASTPAPAAPEPDLAACPARELLEEGLRQRTAPIAVPAALRGIMRSDMDNFAVVTSDGTTVCVDASWMEEIHDPALSPDGRFVTFEWGGYEAFGHVIVDRAGKGRVIDTGVPTVASPSGRRLAAADLSESEFGALNAFAVWEVTPSAIRQLARHEDVPPVTAWRIEGWAGEGCLDLTAIPWEGYTGEADAARERFHARETGGWRLEPGRCAAA